jgi:N-acetylmuramate 1-kinase
MAVMNTSSHKEHQRDILAHDFLASTTWRHAERVFLTGDSSIRSYDRLTLNGRTAILMNAPLDEANLICKPGMTDAQRQGIGYFAARRLAGARIDAFVCIGEWLRAQGCSVPEIYAYDQQNGFALLEDFGDAQYWTTLEINNNDEWPMYQAATDVLARLDAVVPPTHLRYRDLQWPLMTYDTLARDTEAELFLTWYVEKHLKQALSPALRQSYRETYNAVFHQLYKVLDNAPQTMVMRDYHAPNLVWLPQRHGHMRAGLLDFQDNVLGHPAYNLMFLLNDARRAVSPLIAENMLQRYFVTRGMDRAAQADFMAAYFVYLAMNALRLTAWPLRMKYTYHKPHYMIHLPRIMGYLRESLRHDVCAPLAEWFNTYLPDIFKG